MFYQVINTLSENLKRKYKYLEKTRCKIITKNGQLNTTKYIIYNMRTFKAITLNSKISSNYLCEYIMLTKNYLKIT